MRNHCATCNNLRLVVVERTDVRTGLALRVAVPCPACRLRPVVAPDRKTMAAGGNQ